MNENHERLITSRMRVTITGDKRVAYAQKEISTLTGIPPELLTVWEEQQTLPATIFLWGSPYYTGHQFTLMYHLWKGQMTWANLQQHWGDPDGDQDLWPRNQ